MNFLSSTPSIRTTVNYIQTHLGKVATAGMLLAALVIVRSWINNSKTPPYQAILADADNDNLTTGGVVYASAIEDGSEGSAGTATRIPARFEADSSIQLAAAFDEPVTWDSQPIRHDGRHVIQPASDSLQADSFASNERPAGVIAPHPSSNSYRQSMPRIAHGKPVVQSPTPNLEFPVSARQNSDLNRRQLADDNSFQAESKVTHIDNGFVQPQAGPGRSQAIESVADNSTSNDFATDGRGGQTSSATVIRNNEFRPSYDQVSERSPATDQSRGNQLVQNGLPQQTQELNKHVQNPYLKVGAQSQRATQTALGADSSSLVAQASTIDEDHKPLGTRSTVPDDGGAGRYPIGIRENQSNDFAVNQIQSKQIQSKQIQSKQVQSNDLNKVDSLDNSFQTPSTPIQKAQVQRVASVATPVAPKQPEPSPKDNSKTPRVLLGASNFVLAEQPKIGAHWKGDRPLTDQRAVLTETIKEDFSPDALNEHLPYDPYHQMDVYEGKTLNSNQRPIVELGRPWYQLGQLSEGYNFFGKHNNITPQLLIYGDVRSAYATNTQNGDNVTQSAFEVNLDFDLKLTGTERLHMFMSPLDKGGVNTGYLFDDDEWVEQFDADIDFGYFEGDLGAMMGGLMGETLPFDFPFAIGVMPLLLQNGVWMEDAFLGVAATIPAKNSAKFDISNMDITFFAGFDKITSAAFQGDDSAGRMWGMASFIEALNGYFEVDYAFLEDRTFDNRTYHNFGFGYTRRYGRLVSNSTRVIANMGQSTDVVSNTADGVLLLSENSLITGAPSTVVPYFNMFAGFDRPQSAARAGAAGGVLRNTGILFESDGMTNYPTLDATANDAFGAALGLNLLASDFTQQLVVEAAFLNVMGNDATRNAAGDQLGFGVRYQLPLTNAIIFRADGMYGFKEDEEDVHGFRVELRHKY